MRLGLLIIGATFSLIHSAGCKGVGTVCHTSGSTDECGDGMICTFARNPGDPNDPENTLPPVEVCLRQCEGSSDCGEGELCNIVFCSDQKSCQTGAPPDPPEDLCMGGTGGTGGAAGAGGTGGAGGTAGMGGTAGTGGNRACNSTANAFIKTIDPNDKFNQTNFVGQDTTSIPDTWNRYSIELVIDAGLVGQLLQFGFSATASNDEPSGVFYDNVLVDPGAEYTEDFESLDQASPDALGVDPDPLWGEGWVVFGNVYQADGTTFIRGYGTFQAPNNTGGFSGIALGQGGVDQGDQVLVIISDYNNREDQEAGNRVEANTFRERSIVAGDVGKTITFRFDAKRGNINEGCPSP